MLRLLFILCLQIITCVSVMLSVLPPFLPESAFFNATASHMAFRPLHSRSSLVVSCQPVMRTYDDEIETHGCIGTYFSLPRVPCGLSVAKVPTRHANIGSKTTCKLVFMETRAKYRTLKIQSSSSLGVDS